MLGGGELNLETAAKPDNSEKKSKFGAMRRIFR
jgi:hypothetical protein